MKINRYVKIVIYFIAFFVTFNLTDYLYTTFISKEGYFFGILDNLALPVVCAIMLGGFTFFRENKKNTPEELKDD